MIKNKIYNYFFLEFFKLFFIISLSLATLIWFSQAARLLELITEYGNPVQVYLQYLIFNYPKIYNKLIILSFLISLFFFLSKLESSHELNIYWFSGVEKNKILKLILLISLIILTINLILSIFISPLASLKARDILSQSKFSLINALVKEKNFNSPLKGLTIYVDSNNQKGQLSGVFIYEKDRTIIAQSGEVILDENNQNFLRLYNGVTQEKNNKKINLIYFSNTVFDLSNYQMKNIGVPKYSERDILWLLEVLTNKNPPPNEKLNDIRQEINYRLIKPFIIITISIFSSFLLYSNKEKIKINKLKIYLFSISIFYIILNEIFLSISSQSLKNTFLYITTTFSIMLISFILLKIFLNKENQIRSIK